MDVGAISVLTRPGTLVFPSNLAGATDFDAHGGRASRLPSGHLVFYGPHGRRILATDPEGTPLHECEWATTAQGDPRLVRARVRLDWGQWVGLKPGGLVNATTLDLSRKPGWHRLQSDDLRQMAAQALQVPLEDIRFFYGDEDLVIGSRGQASIRHRKDALYLLENGTFEAARFMACLGAMHWERIDCLPVVELFQSLVPGTGSAALELIRSLYDDQNQTEPLPLRYRGIPPYPSEAAYRLFGAFFTPCLPGGGDPFPVFMDPPRSRDVIWLPCADPPQRHFDVARRLCVTISGQTVRKATLTDDPTGLSFMHAEPGGFAPCGRSLSVSHGTLILRDGGHTTEIPVSPAWGTIQETNPLNMPAPLGGAGTREGGWRALFSGAPPQVNPQQAYSVVLLYPDDNHEIEEAASQPFVADFLQDALEQEPALMGRVAKAERVLIAHFEAALAACLNLDRPRTYTILYQRPAFAQRQAQHLWDRLARAKRLEWASRFAFVPADAAWLRPGDRSYDLLYYWIPYGAFDQPERLERAIHAIAGALAPDGLAFLVGPAPLGGLFQAQSLRLIIAHPVDSLPTFRLHRTILPQARLKAGLTVFQAQHG